jgi:ATP-binding protein involved in chromosome partitioning
MPEENEIIQPESLIDVKNVLLVGSGKGGVGKSTIAANLAAAFKRDGLEVGIMDADIYGPSIPPMLGISGPPGVKNEKMVPPVGHGIKIMSIGFLTREEDALIWRGPILHKVLKQFIEEVNWGHLDWLVVDLPPGTGDVQISLAQMLIAGGALMVTTPQDIAWRDVRRAATMFDKVNVPIVGLVENMSFFICPNCGEVTEIFPRPAGDAKREVAEGVFIETLARIPIEPSIAASSEKGMPIVLAEPESETAKIFMELAKKIAGKISK